jgi:hypothetical protein
MIRQRIAVYRICRSLKSECIAIFAVNDDADRDGHDLRCDIRNGEADDPALAHYNNAACGASGFPARFAD